jgi:integrative and conjugative element protein (TIGR02256 family)
VITVPIGNSRETIVIADHVLRHCAVHRQVRFWQREAGGLLFARVSPGVIRIEEATGPRPTDRRSRRSYEGDRSQEQCEIDERHPNGLHYVGDWHTHPERFPKPSSADDLAMSTRVTASTHQLRGLLFAIVGTAPPPNGLALFLHDGRERLALRKAEGVAYATS